jgi:hypothetical protein
LIDAYPINITMAAEILVLLVMSPPGVDYSYELEQLGDTITYTLDGSIACW